MWREVGYAFATLRHKQKRRPRAGCQERRDGKRGAGYFAILYVLSPAAFFEDSIVSPPLLPRMLTKPLTVCFGQPVVSIISARVTPFARFIIAMTSAFLLVRSAAGFGAFLAGLAGFIGFAALAAFLAFGALFFELAPFFEEGFSGATGAPCSATEACWWSWWFLRLSYVSGYPFLRVLRACRFIALLPETSKQNLQGIWSLGFGRILRVG